MVVPANKADLENLITSKIGESASLEYKAAAALDRRNPKYPIEITKDVSAFANSAGGVLIYGIKECDSADLRHLPDKLTPVDVTDYSREWLDSIITQIQPKIADLEIRPVHIGPRDNDFCFVVVIPQSGTAHQATDLRYYKRHNFTATAMEDYEIRDVMNRQKHPRLSVLMRIHTDHYHYLGGKVLLNIKNDGAVMARHFLLNIDMPLDLGDGTVRFEEEGFQAALIGDDVDGSFWRLSIGNRLNLPIFPQSILQIEADFKLINSNGAKAKLMDDADVTLYADSMPPVKVLKNIPAAHKDWV